MVHERTNRTLSSDRAQTVSESRRIMREDKGTLIAIEEKSAKNIGSAEFIIRYSFAISSIFS